MGLLLQIRKLLAGLSCKRKTRTSNKVKAVECDGDDEEYDDVIVTRMHRLTEMKCCQKDEDEMVWDSAFGVVTSSDEHV